MTTPNRVRVSVERLAAAGGAFDERIDRLDARGTPDADLRSEIRAVGELWRAEGFGTFTALDPLGDEIDLDAIEEAEGEIRLIVGKRPTAATFYFLTARGVPELLGAFEHAKGARQVLVAGDFAPFRAVGCLYAPWTAMTADPPELAEPNTVVPRRVVRDQLAQVPLSVGPIILAEAPAEESEVFSRWREAACRQLLTTLCDEIWSDEGTIRISLSGPRLRKLAAGFEQLFASRNLAPANEAAAWVYDSGKDVETRHTLFVYELAREWTEDTPFAAGFVERAPGALEAAKSAFRMHVRDASKETLKSLQDLRKNLAEDVGRIVALTREISGTMWRDLLVVVAAMLGRLALIAAPKPEEAQLADGILYGLSAYLAFSIGMTLFANARFMRISRTSRASWQEKLYGFVDPDDLKALAVEPIEAAEGTYRWTQRAAIAAYLIVIAALVLLAAQPAPKRVDLGKQDGAASPNSTPRPEVIPTAASAPATKQPVPPPARTSGADTNGAPVRANPRQKSNETPAASAPR